MAELKPYRTFLLIALICFTAMFVLEHINGRSWFSDFRVYWSAADALLHGQQVYGVPFGESTGFYKYSPFVAMLFVPFALLPFEVASAVWYWCVAAATVASIIALHRLLGQHVFMRTARRTDLILFLGLLCIGNHLVREIHLGNVNVVLMLLALLAFRASSERPAITGALLALLFMVKPYLGILFVPFALRGQWRVMAAAVATGAAMLALPVLFGSSRSLELHREWLQAMAQHSGYLNSGDTLSSLMHRATGIADAMPLRSGIIGVVVALTVILAWRIRNTGPQDSSAYLLFFGILALVPNLVITDTQHFLWALPLFAFVLHHLFRHRDVPVLIAFVVLCLLHGGNSSDLLGSDLSYRMEAWGVLGMANLLLITLCVLIAARTPANTATS